MGRRAVAGRRRGGLPQRLAAGMVGLLLAVAAGAEPARPAPGSEAPAGPSATPPISPMPPEVFKPVLPSEFDTAETVFRKLDVGKRGFVTPDETKDLLGFEAAFRSVDTAGSGRLTPAQFKKAWSVYRQQKR